MNKSIETIKSKRKYHRIPCLVSITFSPDFVIVESLNKAANLIDIILQRENAYFNNGHISILLDLEQLCDYFHGFSYQIYHLLATLFFSISHQNNNVPDLHLELNHEGNEHLSTALLSIEAASIRAFDWLFELFTEEPTRTERLVCMKLTIERLCCPVCDHQQSFPRLLQHLNALATGRRSLQSLARSAIRRQLLLCAAQRAPCDDVSLEQCALCLPLPAALHAFLLFEPSQPTSRRRNSLSNMDSGVT